MVLLLPLRLLNKKNNNNRSSEIVSQGQIHWHAWRSKIRQNSGFTFNQTNNIDLKQPRMKRTMLFSLHCPFNPFQWPFISLVDNICIFSSSFLIRSMLDRTLLFTWWRYTVQQHITNICFVRLMVNKESGFPSV